MNLVALLAGMCSAAAIGVWPWPRSMSWPVPLVTSLSPSFAIAAPYHPYLSPAVNRYLQLIKTEGSNPLVSPAVDLTNGSQLQTLVRMVKDPAPLVHGVNESYSPSIPILPDRATLIAETAWGAMGGLETFSQLIWNKPTRVAVGVEASDWPVYAYIGIIPDTSRNFYEVEDILKTIGAI